MKNNNLFIILIAFSFISCSPLWVKYKIVSNHYVSGDTIYLNNGEQKLLLELDKSHYPGKTLKNNFTISFFNSSVDSVLINRICSPQIESILNLIDSLQFESLSKNDCNFYLAAQETRNFNYSYRSTTFKGNFSSLMEKLQFEEIKVFVNFEIVNGKRFSDTISLRPILDRFK